MQPSEVADYIGVAYGSIAACIVLCLLRGAGVPRGWRLALAPLPVFMSLMDGLTAKIWYETFMACGVSEGTKATATMSVLFTLMVCIIACAIFTDPKSVAQTDGKLQYRIVIGVIVLFPLASLGASHWNVYLVYGVVHTAHIVALLPWWVYSAGAGVATTVVMDNGA